MDIINKIDSVLSRIDTSGYLPKEDVCFVIEEIIDTVEEDSILLEAFLNNVKNNWSVSNKSLIKDFKRILEYYGIVDGDEKRKMVVETKGKHVVRRRVSVNSKEISEIIKKY